MNSHLFHQFPFLLLPPVALGLFYFGLWIPNEPSVAEYPVRGIDVSHHNGEIDWPEVASDGVAFAFIKTTEGADWQDKRFAQNWADAQAAGIITGAYHFFSTQSSGLDQAANFIATVPRGSGNLPPVIGAEFARDHSQMSDVEFHQNLEILSRELQAHYGVEPIIYTTKEFHDDYFAGRQLDRLWTRAVLGYPYPLARGWLFWQYSSRGRLDGIQGRVDLNVFQGSKADFSALLSP